MPIINLRLLMEPDTVQLEITNEQCNTIKEKVEFLQNTLSEIDYCLMLRENIQEAFEDFKTNGAGIDNNFIRLNRYLMNWLNSFYAWIEHHERHYKELFSSLKSYYYDSYFSYRFAYEMRKYTTHQSLCISRIVYDVLNESTKYIIPIDEILTHGREIKSSLRQELTQMKTNGTEIDLVRFTKEFLAMFESFQNELWKRIIPKLDEKCHDLMVYIEPYLDKPITGYRIKENDIITIDVGVTLNRYTEKKKCLESPEVLMRYLSE